MKKINAMYVAVLALVLAVAAIGMCVICCSSQKSGNLEAKLLENPEMIVKALEKYEQNMQAKMQADAQKLINDNIEAINNNPDSSVLGNPDGSIVLVEFFDFSCGYCHRLYPAIKSLIAKNPELKVVTKELAFVSPNSLYAAKAAIAANKQGKYAPMYHAMLTYEGQLSEVIVDEIAQKVGLDMAKYKSDVASADVDAIMKANSELARNVQINGVPALILNGQRLNTIDEGVIQETINSLKK